jgi:hypothetical protein
VRDQGGEAVFPGRSGSPVAYSKFAAAPAKADLNAFRDWAGDIGRIDRDLTEAALAHALGAVEGAYRREIAIEARRPAMETPARWLEGGRAGVIGFPARA